MFLGEGRAAVFGRQGQMGAQLHLRPPDGSQFERAGRKARHGSARRNTPSKAGGRGKETALLWAATSSAPRLPRAAQASEGVKIKKLHRAVARLICLSP